MDSIKELSPSNILRFNFAVGIIDLINQFAKLHQFDDRHMYREQWDKWFEENNTILSKERDRLTEFGYDGDIDEKMYKAGRYYFRKKINKSKKVIDKSEGKRNYVAIDKVIIEEMDKHIRAHVNSSSSRTDVNSLSKQTVYTPAIGYSEFCKLQEKLLTAEQQRLKLTYKVSDASILNKFKKTYKNRYFISK